MSAPRRRLILVGSRLQAYREYGMASLARHYDVALVTSQPLTWEQSYVSSHRIADTTNAAGLAAAADELIAEAGGEVGIFTWDELSLIATAEVAEGLSLPHMSVRAASVCRDKYATRRLIEEAGLPSVSHRLVHDEHQAVEAAEEVGYPVVLKPRSLAGSLGVILVREPAELPAGYRVAAGASLPGLPDQAGVLVEEFLDGPEISVDSCVIEGDAEPVFVARKRLGFDPVFEEVGHLVGPWRHEPWAASVVELIRSAHRAVGVDMGVTHTEVRLTKAGPRLVELNGRLGGDLIPYLGLLAFGVDLSAAGGCLAFGERPDLTPKRTRCAEIRFLYPPYDGVVERIQLGGSATVPDIVEVVPLALPGATLLLPPRALTPRTAALIALADDEGDCTIALDDAEGRVLTSMRGSSLAGLGAVVENPITRRFLAPERGRERQVVDGVRGDDWFRYGAGGGDALNRPILLASAEVTTLETDLNGVFALLTSIPARLFDDDRRAFAAAVGMSDTQSDVVMRGAGAHLAPMARADMYREPGGFRLMELNTGSSLGGWQMAEFGRAMVYDQDFRRFTDAERLVYPDPLGAIAGVLMDECAGLDMPSRPVLALTDWPDGFAMSKCWLDFLIPGWLRLGFDPIVCHLGELTYRSGVPFLHGRKVDVVYRVFLPGEMTDEDQTHELVDPLLDAVERGHTHLFAGLDCELYGNKGSLAMLSDERNRHAFTSDERELVDRVLPWTRFLRDEKVWLRGEVVDLVPHVLAHKDQLALKPTLLYGGVGVVPGWVVSEREWSERVRASVGGPFVVQERVLPLAERFARDDGTGFEPMVVSYGVMMIGSRYAGMLARGVADPNVGIVSMSKGALIGCAFHVQHQQAAAGGARA